jgi:predicted nucleotidyltransferase component of viral defense system
VTPPSHQISGPGSIGASVRARLLNLAKQQGLDYNALLVRYAQERFLYRLSVSRYASNFILKGALLLRMYPLPAARITKDIDFLGVDLSNGTLAIDHAIRRILEEECEDGIDFHPENTTVEKIAEQAAYAGVRAKVHCVIGGAQISVQIDTGFGDVITPGTVRLNYPVLLDFPVPRLAVYPLETSIAEKAQSLARLGVLTSRMKDIYDILLIAENRTFKLGDLSAALSATFIRRATDITTLLDILGEEFSSNKEKQRQWLAFLNLQGGQVQIELAEALRRLRDFLAPVLHLEGDRHVWNPSAWSWEDGLTAPKK